MTPQEQYDLIMSELKSKKEAGLNTDYEKAEYFRLTLKSIDLWIQIKKQNKQNG